MPVVTKLVAEAVAEVQIEPGSILRISQGVVVPTTTTTGITIQSRTSARRTTTTLMTSMTSSKSSRIERTGSATKTI